MCAPITPRLPEAATPEKAGPRTSGGTSNDAPDVRKRAVVMKVDGLPDLRGPSPARAPVGMNGPNRSRAVTAEAARLPAGDDRAEDMLARYAVQKSSVAAVAPASPRGEAGRRRIRTFAKARLACPEAN